MTGTRAAASVASLAAAVALLAYGLPHLVGADLAGIGAALAAVPGTVLAVLVALWLAGLWAYTYVVTASLPGLTRGRAFALNAVGGAASNLLPFGGALGTVLVYTMARGWGHDRRSVRWRRSEARAPRVVLTPNGFGVSETGAAAVLVTLGAAAGPAAAAAVLLFGLITHVLEIVLGMASGAVWVAGRRAAA